MVRREGVDREALLDVLIDQLGKLRMAWPPAIVEGRGQTPHMIQRWRHEHDAEAGG